MSSSAVGEVQVSTAAISAVEGGSMGLFCVELVAGSGWPNMLANDLTVFFSATTNGKAG